MTARTRLATALALLPVLMLSIYAIAMREMNIAGEVVAVVSGRYLVAAGLAALVAVPLGLLRRRAGAARGRGPLLAFLGLLNVFVLAHISATMTLT